MQAGAAHADPPYIKPHFAFPAFSPSFVPEVGTNLAQVPAIAAMQLGPVSY